MGLQTRETKYIESASQNTFYPFQNKHQNHWHFWSVRMLCAFKNPHIVTYEMGQANKRTYISTNDVRSIYSISLLQTCLFHKHSKQKIRCLILYHIRTTASSSCTNMINGKSKIFLNQIPLHLPSCGPGFKSQAQNLGFFQFTM